MANMKSREMEPTKQEIFSVLPEISREDGALTSDTSVWLPWQVRMGASDHPNFLTSSVYINQLLFPLKFYIHQENQL